MVGDDVEGLVEQTESIRHMIIAAGRGRVDWCGVRSECATFWPIYLLRRVRDIIGWSEDEDRLARWPDNLDAVRQRYGRLRDREDVEVDVEEECARALAAADFTKRSVDGLEARTPPGRERQERGAEPGSSEESRPLKTKAPGKLAVALSLLQIHPDWTNVKIAEHAHCNPKYLSQCPEFVLAKKTIKKLGIAGLPKGTKTREGHLEASLEGDAEEG
jgi:hypothetical protein